MPSDVWGATLRACEIEEARGMPVAAGGRDAPLKLVEPGEGTLQPAAPTWEEIRVVVGPGPGSRPGLPTLDHVDHILGDVGGEIGNPLHVLGHHHDLQQFVHHHEVTVRGTHRQARGLVALPLRTVDPFGVVRVAPVRHRRRGGDLDAGALGHQEGHQQGGDQNQDQRGVPGALQPVGREFGQQRDRIVVQLTPADRVQIAEQVDDIVVPRPPYVSRCRSSRRSR